MSNIENKHNNRIYTASNLFHAHIDFISASDIDQLKGPYIYQHMKNYFPTLL